MKCPDEEIVTEKKVSRSKKRTVSEKPAPLPKIVPGSIKSLVARIDGASDGNPGPSGIGVVFEYEDGTVIGELSEAIGERTSNQAEYLAALGAAKKASEWGVEKLTLITDSELVKKQLKREYRVKNPEIIKLYERLYVILSKFKKWDVKHVNREKNREADRLSKLALKK
ncbi:MAG: ribonuclease HI family protein [bacterium]